MRGFLTFLWRCWKIDRALYRVHVLEDEHDYHRVNLAFHAARAVAFHLAVLEAKREVNRLAQEPEYLPSVHQLSARR